ncbi:MAG TPA: N-6 DNA methylase, partial [Coriobacteriia bacterium]
GINGAVESDFFDWLLDVGGGADLVMRIARQVARFRLIAVEHDIGKVLYESLIDPEERHELGEFYTPDWLADLICEASIERPTEERVLDPACGSGTFPFFALRRLLAAADDAGLSNRAALDLATEKVLGIDIHPVAVLIARVTYLLALGSERLRQERSALTIPIYLGDSLQWNTASFLAGREVLIQVPDGGPTLLFPFVITRDPNLFDRVIEEMLSLSERGADGEVFAAWLRREGITDIEDFKVLGETYWDLRQLQADDRNHIWGYVARDGLRQSCAISMYSTHALTRAEGHGRAPAGAAARVPCFPVKRLRRGRHRRARDQIGQAPPRARSRKRQAPRAREEHERGGPDDRLDRCEEGHRPARAQQASPADRLGE